MSEDAKTDTDATDGGLARRRIRLFVGLAIAAVVVAFIWLVWASGLLVESVTPAVRDEITGAIEAATDPAEQARLRLELVALEQEDAARRSGLLGTIAQVGTALLAGSAAAWGAVAAWNQMRDNRRRTEDVREETAKQLDLAQQQLDDNRSTTARQLQLAHAGQVAERFTRAVGQIGQPGKDKLDVRLGGIYALERIARDSKADTPTVVEVLAAFVRGHSRLPESTDDDASAALPPDAPEDDDGESKPLSRRAADVQAAITVLGRMDREPGPAVVDLAAAHLERADLIGANLAGADLRGAHLTRADLRGAHLMRADLRGAHLEDAYLVGVDLKGVYLTGAYLEDADLRGANLERADFSDAHLERADLRGANLERADLRGAHLERAIATIGRFAAPTQWPYDYSSTRWPEDYPTRWPEDYSAETAEAEGVIVHRPPAAPRN